MRPPLLIAHKQPPLRKSTKVPLGRRHYYSPAMPNPTRTPSKTPYDSHPQKSPTALIEHEKRSTRPVAPFHLPNAPAFLDLACGSGASTPHSFLQWGLGARVFRPRRSISRPLHYPDGPLSTSSSSAPEATSTTAPQPAPSSPPCSVPATWL